MPKLNWLKSTSGELINVRHIRTLKKVERSICQGATAWVWLAVGKNESWPLAATDEEIQQLTGKES